MTTYYKPRWPNRVVFGSHRDLKYRIDILNDPETVFKVRTHSGPGFELYLVRYLFPPGFYPTDEVPVDAEAWWLSDSSSKQVLADLFDIHFSVLHARVKTIECYCFPERHDIIPEGPQLSWCLSQIHKLWSAVPESHRRDLRKSVFIE